MCYLIVIIVIDFNGLSIVYDLEWLVIIGIFILLE